MNRRHAITAGVALAAAATGAGWNWWKQRGAHPAPVLASADPSFWALSFESPTGAPVELQTRRGQPLLLNFWATWCPPCLKEMPLLDEFARQQGPAGWQVVGLAVDNPAAVREFVSKRSLGFPIGMAGLSGIDLSRGLGNRQGSLPFTAVFDRQGTLAATHLGALAEADLAEWVRQMGATNGMVKG